MTASNLRKWLLRKLLTADAKNGWAGDSPMLDDYLGHLLPAWARSCWPDYDRWLETNSLNNMSAWRAQREEARSWEHCPLISLVTPVFNTDPVQLAECIDSVRFQTYPEWQLCLADDGSSRNETVALLEHRTERDARIQVSRLAGNGGICTATNNALKMAQGTYVVFLDHDDRLTPDALFHIARTLRENPAADILYSDKDMISEQGQRFMHLFKPDWSPETLLSGNYLFHLMAYRRSLLERLGGIDPRYEGSQDYALILRAADENPLVAHIPHVLYSWRQHARSVSLRTDDKSYAFDAGLRALSDTLQRRGLKGNAEEIPHLWKGNYRVRLQPPPAGRVEILHLPEETGMTRYRELLNARFDATPCDFLVVLGQEVTPDADAIDELISWFQVEAVGMVTGKVMDPHGCILHAGMVQRPNGLPLSLFQGFAETEPGYMAATSVTRNVSAPHPYCVALRQKFWQSMAGMSREFTGPHALLDLALRGLDVGHRCVFNPFAKFRAGSVWPDGTHWPDSDRILFQHRWGESLQQGDRYYSPHLSLMHKDMRLKTADNPIDV